MALHLRHTTLSVFLLTIASTVAQATTFDTIYSFGDSLSDVGNIYAATGGLIPGAPYVNGHFTNGQVWVQDLSASLGLGAVTPSQLGGNDFAYGGAYSGNSPVHTSSGVTAPTDLLGATGQISQFQAVHPTADPNALYTIWIGSNDLLAVLASNPSASQAALDLSAVIGNVDTAIGDLAGEGAKNFLVVTVPDLGKTPGVIAQGAAAVKGGSTLAAEFDTGLAGSLPTSGLNISVLDTFSLVDGLVANGAAYGFTNVNSPCVTGAVDYVGGTPCSSSVAGQDQYLFWDDLHPTAAGHQLLADAALNTLAPEPATYALIGFGLFGVYLHRRRQA